MHGVLGVLGKNISAECVVAFESFILQPPVMRTTLSLLPGAVVAVVVGPSDVVGS